jgi:hypothetical protein
MTDLLIKGKHVCILLSLTTGWYYITKAAIRFKKRASGLIRCSGHFTLALSLF